MHSILLVIAEPVSSDYAKKTERDSLLLYAHSRLKTHKGGEMLGANCFFLNAGDEGLDIYAQLVARANQAGIPHKTLFFEREPVWVPKVND